MTNYFLVGVVFGMAWIALGTFTLEVYLSSLNSSVANEERLPSYGILLITSLLWVVSYPVLFPAAVSIAIGYAFFKQYEKSKK